MYKMFPINQIIDKTTGMNILLDFLDGIKFSKHYIFKIFIHENQENCNENTIPDILTKAFLGLPILLALDLGRNNMHYAEYYLDWYQYKLLIWTHYLFSRITVRLRLGTVEC